MITGLCDCSASVASYWHPAIPNLVASTPCLACWAARTLYSTFVPSTSGAATTIPEDNPAILPAENTPSKMAANETATSSSPQTVSSKPKSGHRKSRSIGEIDKQTKKRTYRFAHPPPINKKKQILKLRPRILLQLHQVSDSLRPSPILDVLPSSIFPSGLPFKFAKLFRGKAGLGPRDLVIIGSDALDRQISLNGEDQFSTNDANYYENQIISTICQKDSSVEGVDITFSDGQSWKATPLSNGSYEFRLANDDGTITKARWVLRKRPHQRAGSNNELQRSKGEIPEKKFSFSLINPTKRRHAVIASMTRECISVNERYQPVVDPAPQDNEQSSDAPSSTSSPIDESFPDNLDDAENPHKWIETDEKLRLFITASAVWVLFKEGWSTNFSYDDSANPSNCNSSPGNKTTRHDEVENGNHAKTARRTTSFVKRPTTLQRNSTSRVNESLKLDRTRSEGRPMTQDEMTPKSARGGISVNGHDRANEHAMANGKGDPSKKSTSSRRCRSKWRKFRGAFALVR